jgi:hypothetical protein
MQIFLSQNKGKSQVPAKKAVDRGRETKQFAATDTLGTTSKGRGSSKSEGKFPEGSVKRLTLTREMISMIMIRNSDSKF